jgi:adenosylhomocysteinase
MPPVADRGLAGAGRDRIEWADAQMPVLRSIRERFAAERPLAGVRVAASLHVTAETANLVRALTAGGARVGLAAANPFTTQDDVAASLAAHHDVAVRAVRGEGPDAYASHLAALVADEPQITFDDGADLVTALHEQRPEAAGRVLAALEETTTGLLRLRLMEAAGRLRCPVFAVNEARAERVYNDRFGTGQSTLDGILRATNLLLAGRTFVVLGYGWTGQGVALRARGAGASVIVCEVDPLRALEARMEGFQVMPALAAAEQGDVFVTVTGSRGVLGRRHFERMKDGAVLANAGHFDVEISLTELMEIAVAPPRRVRPLVDQFDVGGRRLNLLARGRVVNLAAAEGHPAAVMDVSFAIQALTCEYAIARGGDLPPEVHPVPDAIDRETARLKLSALGVSIDTLSEAQQSYLRGWARE